MHRMIEALARTFAVLGGIVLMALIAMTCISVLGRGGNTLGHSDWLTGLSPDLARALIATGIRPITGDYELVEAGIAFAIFAFLPLCHLQRGHASVDIFTNALPPRANLWLIAFWEVIFALVLLLITWRLGVGAEGKYGNGETTFLLQFPIWWAYVASFVAAFAASLTAVYVAGTSLLVASAGRTHAGGQA